MYTRNCATVRRLNILQRILTNSNGIFGVQRNLVRAFNIDGKVTIDDVSKDIRPPKNPEYVPQKFCKCKVYSNFKKINRIDFYLHFLQ